MTVLDPAICNNFTSSSSIFQHLLPFLFYVPCIFEPLANSAYGVTIFKCIAWNGIHVLGLDYDRQKNTSTITRKLR